ncbi:hypothetical protein [Arthrobacter gallicola]|uniref:hypothetical protein n=1 Tax=Arthrobacter gallicola TaxID=2762225 RepID=UPI00384B7FAC
MAFSSRNLIALARTALRAARSLSQGPAQPPRPARTRSRATPPAARPGSGASGGSRNYAGDYRGTVVPVYAPQPDGAPDPGEVV